MRELRSLLQRIGSPNAVSWPGFWVTFLANVMIGVLGNAATLNGEVAGRLLIAGVSQLVLFAPAVLVWVLWVRDSPRSRPWLMLAAFAAGGMARGITVILLEALLGLPDGYSPVHRIAASVTIMVIALVTVAISVDIARESVAADAELAEYRARTSVAAIESSARIQQQRDAALQDIQRQLEMRMRASAPAQLASALRRIVDEVVRPLSRMLFDGVPAVAAEVQLRRASRRGWRVLLAEMSRAQPLTPPFTELLLLAAALPWVLAITVLPLGPIVFVVAAAVAIGLSVATNVLFSRLRAMASGQFAVALTVAAMVPGMVWLLAGLLILDAGAMPIIVAPVAFTIIGTWLLAALRAAARRNRRRRDDIAAATAERDLTLARVRAIAWRERQDFAHALHGPLLGTLIANAIRIEDELASGGSGELARRRLDGELRDALLMLESSAELSPLTAALQDLRELWAGIAEVEWSLPDDACEQFANDATATVVLTRVAIEACSNAVRHGSATRVSIEFGTEASGRTAWVRVVDNGTRYASDGSAAGGVGSSLLDDVTVEWSRTRAEGATQLFARIALGEAPVRQDATFART